jgi:hypothetical protein
MEPVLVTTSRGEVVGIGKIKIPRTSEFDYEIPMLSFIVIKESAKSFVATCMHLQLDGYGAADDLAVGNMADRIRYFLRENFQALNPVEAWANLKDLSHVDETSELWNAYRDVQFELAQYGIPTDSIGVLKRKISQLQTRIDQLATKNDQLVKELEKVRELYVDYIPVRKAA